MDRGNIFSGGAFRVTVYATLALVIVAALTAFVGFRNIQAQQYQQIRDQIEPIVASLDTLARDDGEGEMIGQLRQLVPQLEKFGQRVALFDAQSNQILGATSIAADFSGWQIRDLDPAHEGGDAYLLSTRTGSMGLIIGSDLTALHKIETAFIRTVILITSFLSILFIGLGYLTSHLVQTKLERMGDTLQRVSDGQKNARLEVSAANDQIDRVSRKMNLHLDSLAALMSATQNSATAIAHDLKRPLARAMLGVEAAIDLVEAGHDPQDALSEAQQELAKLTRIFETILRISRIQHGEAMQGSVDLADLVRDIGESYQVVAEESGQSLRLDVDEGVTVRGDAGMLSQMLVNLLQNAVTYGSEGNRIEVRLTSAAGQALLTVADTGPGIAEADHERVLTPFFRADGARTTEGNGLGLALVKTVADRHGAVLSLTDNAPGLRVAVRFVRG